MKTLDNQTLLYDVDCPLCRVYTKGFVAAKMLDQNGKKPYCEITVDEQKYVDVNRAANQIALIDNVNKTVTYGIDSLLKIIGHSFPWVAKVGNLKLINFFLRKLYSLISYNRKVIIPSKTKTEFNLQCVPDFNYKYRIIYILFASIAAILVSYHFSNLILTSPKSIMISEVIMVLGQIIFQGLFIIKFSKQILLNYVGNLMTVSLMGSLLLMPILIFNIFFYIPEIIIVGWFGLTILAMLFEHSRRVTILKLPSYLSITWAVYMLIAVTITLKIKS